MIEVLIPVMKAKKAREGNNAEVKSPCVYTTAAEPREQFSSLNRKEGI